MYSSAFLDQLTVADMTALMPDTFGVAGLDKIGMPAQKRADDCLGVGSAMIATGDKCLSWVSEVMTARTWNRDRMERKGSLMAIQAAYAGINEVWYGGGNTHRTPFGGRNFEYMSECPILNYLAGAVEVEAMEKTGSHAGPKHFVGNDQEFYREGLVCFFNEQAFREGSLKAFEGSIRVANAGGLMQSFERLGLKWYSASYALNTTILRNEWGWNGAIDTDAAPCFDEYVDGGYKNHAAEVLDAGTQEWCLDGVGGHGQWVLQKAKDTDDGHLLELLTEAAISWEYAISRSVVTNGTASNSVIEHVTPYWQTAITAEIAVTGILTAVFFVLLVLSKTKKKAKKQ